MSRQSSANAGWLAIGAILGLAACVGIGASSVSADDASGTTPQISAAELEVYTKQMWPHVEPGWEDRLVQDETQAICSRARNNPSTAEADAIIQRETASIKFPADGNLLGSWQEGEKIASSGRGGQFSDPPGTAHGGNCYACHQLAPAEVAYGTLGPSLTGYGKNHDYAPDAIRAAYAKIFNAQAVSACSNMPRFGAHGYLTEQQIKDVNAFLFDRESPVNK